MTVAYINKQACIDDDDNNDDDTSFRTISLLFLINVSFVSIHHHLEIISVCYQVTDDDDQEHRLGSNISALSGTFLICINLSTTSFLNCSFVETLVLTPSSWSRTGE